jgi:hypothetical protein
MIRLFIRLYPGTCPQLIVACGAYCKFIKCQTCGNVSFEQKMNQMYRGRELFWSLLVKILSTSNFRLSWLFALDVILLFNICNVWKWAAMPVPFWGPSYELKNRWHVLFQSGHPSKCCPHTSVILLPTLPSCRCVGPPAYEHSHTEMQPWRGRQHVLPNVCKTAHFYAVETPKSRITIDIVTCTPLIRRVLVRMIGIISSCLHIHNYTYTQAIQCYVSFTQFTVHRCTHSRILSFH